jgi:branched-subunit amino acid aminotransferase/4-amino-4-deoxychorismate lyase
VDRDDTGSPSDESFAPHAFVFAKSTTSARVWTRNGGAKRGNRAARTGRVTPRTPSWSVPGGPGSILHKEGCLTVLSRRGKGARTTFRYTQYFIFYRTYMSACLTHGARASARALVLRNSFKHRLRFNRKSLGSRSPAFRLYTSNNISMMHVITEDETSQSPETKHMTDSVVVSTVTATVSGNPPGGIAWLESMPRGAYTTARTTGSGRCVFELGFHLQRLVDSARLMDMELDSDRSRGGDSISSFKMRVLNTIRRGVEAYMRQHGGYDENSTGEDSDDHEMKITVLVCHSTRGEKPDVHSDGNVIDGLKTDVYVHVSPLGPRKAPGPVKVEIRGGPRTNAAAKDSDWVTERKQLNKPEDVNELVLEANGALYEGLSSNFFALMDGTLYTAGDNVLLGSVRESVLRQAAALNVPVVLDPPRIDDIPRWEAAFVSSTSRMLLPIDELGVSRTHDDSNGSETSKRIFDYAPHSLARTLEAAVKADILSSSEQIF